MLEGIKDFFRKKSLRKHRSTVPTMIMPLGQIRSAVAFIDVEDTSFDTCKQALMAFYRENNIKGEIFFFDFRKLGEGERLITSITTTVLKSDLNWFGKPKKEKMDLMSESRPDAFISLMKSDQYPLEYMAACSEAKFKIGRKQLAGNVFDLVISDPSGRDLSEAEAFLAMKAFLNKIK